MLSVLKTILSRLEKIEKQLETVDTGERKQLAGTSKVVPPTTAQTVSKMEVANITAIHQQARQILVDAKDEAFRIKREAEEESRRIRQETLSIQQRIASKEESIDTK